MIPGWQGGQDRGGKRLGSQNCWHRLPRWAWAGGRWLRKGHLPGGGGILTPQSLTTQPGCWGTPGHIKDSQEDDCPGIWGSWETDYLQGVIIANTYSAFIMCQALFQVLYTYRTLTSSKQPLRYVLLLSSLVIDEMRHREVK